ncbi:MAG: hypothetical protein C5B48_09395 [Candidatus Rokuibacteriota bacterium]|nr:MAG: hypothetical protein C5B48_09395 [Candidatus Rokubacteria bacterium]
MKATMLVGAACAAVTAAVLLPTASAGPVASPLRVAFLGTVTASVDDPRAQAFLHALSRTHVRGRVVFTNPHKNVGGTIAFLAQQAYDLIIVGDYDVNGVPPVAFDFPGLRFLLPDDPHAAMQDQVRFLRPRLPARARIALPRNVEGSRFKVEEAAYLAGYLAALMERRRSGRDVISWVGGRKSPGVDRWIVGYEAGARRADPGIRILGTYTGDFILPARCRKAALAQIARGAGVVFPVAGGCGLGALDAAKEKGVWGIGVDTDQAALGPHILTSAVERLEVGMLDALKAVERGTFETGGDRVYGLRGGAVGLGKISPEVPRAYLRRLQAIRRLIIEGKIRVPQAAPVIRHHR